jgi:hypothetical protein
MVVEGVIAALVLVLGIATTAAALVGIAGLAGVVRLVRCQQCGRLDMTSLSDPSRACVYCRHNLLFHPVYSLHHRHLPHGADRQRAA